MTDVACVQRIDKWLWFARFFKTRSLATKFANNGKIRIKRGHETIRIEKASQNVQLGDILTFALHTNIRVVEVKETGERRGPAKEAQLLYEDLSPPAPRGHKKSEMAPALAKREPGSGRPTKKERRELEQWRTGRN